MNVEIINVGTELLLGEIVNTNATYLQKMCKELGFNVYFQTVVGDNPQRLLDCLDIAFKRGADCIITTGGLGPTQDDLTKELSAQYLGLELVYDEAEAKKVHDKCCFVTQLDEVPDNNYKQAYFPKDCYVLENDVGTANGCVMSKDQKMIINLPGPPKEMTYVVDHVLKPYLEQYRQAKIYTQDIVTMGIGESLVDEKLSKIISHQDKVSIALYASEETVRVRLGCKATHQEQANELMKPVYDQIETILHDYVLETHDLNRYILEHIHGYTIINHCHFDLGDRFQDNQGEVTIELNEQRLDIGDVVEATVTYHHKKSTFKVPLLKDAKYSLARLESRLLNHIYLLIR